MALRLHYHPLSSYCQKVLIALYEGDIPFDPVHIDDLRRPDQREALASLWPMIKFPVLEDEERSEVLPESSIIIEYLAQHYAGARDLVPQDERTALMVRLWDRLFDNYVMTPMQRIVGDRLRPANAKDPHGVDEQRALLGRAYAMIDDRIGDGWAAGGDFSMADCAAIPALFFADRLLPLNGHPKLAAYRDRLLARPSVARAVKEAEPWLQYFPAE